MRDASRTEAAVAASSMKAEWTTAATAMMVSFSSRFGSASKYPGLK